MLRSVDDMTGYRLAAEDGHIGKVEDFLFDETHLAVRWMVADTGRWLAKRKVLISPISLGQPDWKERLFPVRLTREEIEHAPELDVEAPVSREYEKLWFDRYSFPYYWAGPDVWGGAPVPDTLFVRQAAGERDEAPSPEAGADVLRAAREVVGYHIQAADGEIGHLDDLIVDDEAWLLRYLVVDTRNWLPGRKVLVVPDWLEDIDWAERKVSVALTRDAVKNSPEFDPYSPINREYEIRLYDYYGRPVYWA